MALARESQPNGLEERRILWITPMLDFLLHRESLLQILRHLAMRGHNIVLITTWPRNLVRVKTSNMHIKSIPLRYVPLVSPVMFALVLWFFLPVYIIVSKPDFIVTEPDVTILSSIPGLFVSKFRKVRFILDVRSTPVETMGFRGFQQNLWFTTSLLVAKRLFDGMTIITSLMKKEVCSKFDLDPYKVGVWTSGVSTKLFDAENFISASKELKRKLGLTGKFVVFYHGAFGLTRGLTETIEAIKMLRHKHPNIVFFLLGTGSNVAMRRLRALIRKEGLQENVIIHNPVDQSEVPKFIGMCDIGIVPLPDHPFWRFQSPLKLLEYLAMEKVVVLTAIPAHQAVVGEAKCGIYVSSVKPMEIAKAIEHAYFNKENLEEWGKIGRKIVKEGYTWEKVARDLENYLLSIDDRAD
jgi:glycosyltransferase involved in cell wall biosynthesis